MIMGFIDTIREQGRSVESTCRVLTSLGVQVAARTYRAWKAARTLSARAMRIATAMGADAVAVTASAAFSPNSPASGNTGGERRRPPRPGRRCGRS